MLKTDSELKEFIIDRINKNNDCWEWTKALTTGGYPQVYTGYKIINGERFNVYQRGHRISYRIFKEEIPVGSLICHSCDNRKCINPQHLWLGTNKDNVQDCIKKGRRKRQNKNL